MSASLCFRIMAVVSLLFADVLCCHAQQVTFPPDVAATAFANAKTMYVPEGQPTVDNLQRAFLMKWVVESYRHRPLYPPVRLKEQYDQIKAAYEQQTGLQLGMVLPDENEFSPFSALKAVASVFTSTELGLGLAAVDIVDGVGQVSLDRTDSFGRMSQALRAKNSDLVSVAEEFDQLCKNNNVAAVARELIFGITRSDSAVELFQFTPEFNNNTTLQTLMSHTNAQGGITISIAELTSLFQAELARVNGSSSNMLTVLGTLTTNQGVLLHYMTNISMQLSNQVQMAQIAAQHQQVVDAANSSVYILSTLVGFDNPKLGHEMQVVGSSTIQIADALGKFTKKDALQNVILSGNILSAAMNVFSLFGDSGPSPEQIILQELGVIKQMLGQIRMEMHERFDRVDQSLNLIYDTLNDRFNQINLQLGTLQGDVTEIQQALYGLQVDLYRIERGMYAFLLDASRHDLLEEINLIVDYHGKYGQLLPFTDFVTAENRFHTWAVIHAADDELSQSSGRSYTDAAVYAELTSRPWEANLNWLSQFVATRFSGVPNFTSVRLANPHDWSVASHAYLELALESPLNFRLPGLVSRLQEIRQRGVDLNSAATKVTLTTGSTNLVANRALWNALISYYRSKAIPLKNELVLAEQEYRRGLSADPSKQQAYASLNLWGGPDQSFTSPMPPPAAVGPVQAGQNNHGATVAISPPLNWTNMIPPFARLGGFLGVGGDVINLEYRNLDLVETTSTHVVDYNTGASANVTIGKFHLAIRGYATNYAVFEKAYTSTDYSSTFPPSCGSDQTPFTIWFSVPPIYWWYDPEAGDYLSGWDWNGALSSLWTADPNLCGGPYFMNDFVSGSQVTNSTEVLIGINALKARIQDRLRELQRGSYGSIATSLTQAGNVQSAAAGLSGARALLESFITLGFSHSLETDDILRSLVYGTDRIVDTEVIEELCQLGIARSYDTNQNVKVDIAAILDERISGLELWITNRLSELEQEQQGEPLLPVTITLNRIAQFQAVQQVSTPAPYAYALPGAHGGLPSQNLFQVVAEPHVPFRVQTSSEMGSWSDTTNTVIDGAVFKDSTTASRKFYRLLLQP